MTLAELQELHRAGVAVVTPDEAEPWKIVKCSRATWYRLQNTGDLPFVLVLGRSRRLQLAGLLRWLGVEL